MARADLRALTVDDLERLSSRGLVKRAQRDLDEGRLTFTLASHGDEVVLDWAGEGEGRCVFPAGKTARDGRCTCVATAVCRHLVGALLAYPELEAAPEIAATAWDPGAISDDTLKAVFKRVGSLASAGLVEVARRAKPVAHFHELGCVVRFLVPGDARYSHCTCSKPDPCEHAALAVLAFRQLPAQASAGFVGGEDDAPVPQEVFDEAERVVAELATHGMSSLPSLWRDRVVRIERRLREAGLVWPAEIAVELAAEFERYETHDAMFAPERLVELVGELQVRCDAARAMPDGVPQLFIRGGRGDRVTQIGKDVYTGLGVAVKTRRRGVVLEAYLQEAASGLVVAVTKAFGDADGEEPRPFWQLAQGYAGAVPITDLGRGQLVLQGGRRGPDRALSLPRKTSGSQPQAWQWEKIQAPVRVESFAEVWDRLAMLPPSSLRPRHVGEDLHVLPVAGVDAAGFDPTEQVVRVVVRDAAGDTATLVHPFMARAAEGVEALLAALGDMASRLCFVSGRVALGSGALVVSPLAFVFERDGTRRAVLPWIERHPESVWTPSADASGSGDALLDLLQDLCALLGETLLLGAARSDGRVLAGWRDLGRRLQAAGSRGLYERVKGLVDQLEQQMAVARGSPQRAVECVLRLCAVSRMARDVRG